LGYSNGIADNHMEVNCQCLEEGVSVKEVYKGYYTKQDESTKKRIKKNSFDWQLLFQVDDDEKAGTEWGDVGRIYFWIKKKALQTRNFGQTYAFYQGY
jgi:uncharacterized protein YwqG